MSLAGVETLGGDTGLVLLSYLLLEELCGASFITVLCGCIKRHVTAINSIFNP